MKQPDHRQRLLRAHDEQPRGRRAAEQRDELAPSHHSITSSARTRSVGGTSKPRAFAGFKLRTVSYLVGACTGRSVGLPTRAARPSRGDISLSIPNHFPVILASYNIRPVVFPPGRARLATTPAPTGSDTYTKTIGIVRVFACNALTTGVVPAKMTSGL